MRNSTAPQNNFQVGLSNQDRRAILKSSLRLYLRRLSHNLAVKCDDLQRLVPYGDDATRPGETR